MKIAIQLLLAENIKECNKMKLYVRKDLDTQYVLFVKDGEEYLSSGVHEWPATNERLAKCNELPPYDFDSHMFLSRLRKRSFGDYYQLFKLFGNSYYKGKEVLHDGWFDYKHAKKGDLVSQDVIDALVNAMTPSCMRSDCTQSGSAWGDLKDPDTEAVKPAYATFRLIDGTTDNGTWEYCGICFKGENDERGQKLPYVI